MTPTLSILLPTYNGSRYLPAQIDSILDQSDPDFELLAVDDGSTDATVAVLDSKAKVDRRVKIIPSQGNLGQRRRILELIGHASGRYLSVADQDDLWDRRRNEHLLATIGSAALAFGRSNIIDQNGKNAGRSLLEVVKVDPLKASPLGMLFEPMVSAHAAMFKSGWVDPASMFGPNPFDWIWGIEASLSDGLRYSDDAVVNHRIHGGNQMNGVAFQTKPSKISLHQLKVSTNFVRSGRFYFFLMIDQLSRSTTIPAEARKSFTDATNVCRFAWYQPVEYRLRRSRQVADRLIAFLGRYATSPADLEQFKSKIESLAQPQWSPSNMRSAARHYLDRVK